METGYWNKHTLLGCYHEDKQAETVFCQLVVTVSLAGDFCWGGPGVAETCIIDNALQQYGGVELIACYTSASIVMFLKYSYMIYCSSK